MQALGHVPRHRPSVKMNTGKSDMTVRAQQVESGSGNPRAGELPVIGGVAGDHMGSQQVAETRYAIGGCGLADQDEREASVVQLSEQVLGGPVAGKLEPQPGKTIAGPGRPVGQARQRLG